MWNSLLITAEYVALIRCRSLERRSCQVTAWLDDRSCLQPTLRSFLIQMDKPKMRPLSLNLAKVKPLDNIMSAITSFSSSWVGQGVIFHLSNPSPLLEETVVRYRDDRDFRLNYNGRITEGWKKL